MIEKENNQGFEPKGTKISPAMAVVWDAVCEALGTNTYDLIQNFIYSMIRAASEQHEKSPEIQKLLDALDLDPGWQNAINLCAPNGKLNIEQMILIVSQEDKSGFGMVMLDKPYCGGCRQTENVNIITERVIQVGTKKLYQRLRDIGAKLKCERFIDVMLTMIDAQDLLEATEGDRAELPQYGEYHEHGKPVEYGKRTKRVHHKTPDSIAQQQTIHFDDIDRETAQAEVEDWEGEHRQHDDPTDDMEKEFGFRPIGGDW